MMESIQSIILKHFNLSISGLLFIALATDLFFLEKPVVANKYKLISHCIDKN